jgi:hypothetical protein
VEEDSLLRAVHSKRWKIWQCHALNVARALIVVLASQKDHALNVAKRPLFKRQLFKKTMHLM